METLQLIQRKDGSPMLEEDYNSLLPYASLIEFFSELFTSGDNEAVIEKIQRRDGRVLSEEELLPFGGFFLIFALMAPECGDNVPLSEEDVFSDFERVERKDGTPMMEDDIQALLPYSGFLSLWSFLSTDQELDEPPTGSFDDSEDECFSIYEGITRKDGAPLTDDDKTLLMDYGGLVLFLRSFIALRNTLSADPFDEIERLDGLELDADDDAVLMQYYPAFRLLQKAYDSMCTPLAVVFYPDGDEDFAEYGEKLGANLETAEPVFTPDDTEMSYSAWSLVGRGFLAVYHKTFGSFSSPWEKNGSTQTTGLKRKPSGAELSAWIGLATQGAFGLNDPSRKVRARAVL
jgi:hypothetical protein